MEVYDELAKENLRLRKKLDTAINVIRKDTRKIERLNNKLLKIKEAISRTPRQTSKEIAYIWLKSEIAEIMGVDKE